MIWEAASFLKWLLFGLIAPPAALAVGLSLLDPDARGLMDAPLFFLNFYRRFFEADSLAFSLALVLGPWVLSLIFRLFRRLAGRR
jgi:hypothetical protein